MLRAIAAEDLDELHRVWTDPEVRKYIWDGVAITREEAADIIKMIKRATTGGLDTIYYEISRREFEKPRRFPQANAH